ncbi:distal tail protein Dit [Virgibacillus salexigens]|uniref:distal tail protein Dit n=1 Tax=Virgibacillus salexigens TaxID=61016 RepID=UPI00190DF98C|nr:distal tail protein Dit [Virgibacillus salexigens]
MYEFVDINERGTFSTSLSIQTIFNTFNLDEVLTDETGSFMTLTVRGRGNVKQKINYIDVPEMDGSLESNNVTLDMREIEVKYKIKDITNQGFRERINRLNSMLEGSKKVLEFTDENVIYYATLQDNDIPEEESNELICTLIFSCSDPYKYAPELPIEFGSDAGIITNEGTAEAEPIFVLEAIKKVTFALIQNQHGEYMLIGKPVDVTSEVVDARTLLLEERGQSLDTWDTASDSIDNGYVDGTFGTDNDGITVPSYGPDTTDPDWHGPALRKEVPVAQDFEVEAMVQGRTTETSQTFRIEVYLFDEGMNELGKMAIKDDSLGIHRKKGEGRLGPYVGANENYLISSQNYSYDQDYFYGMLRMRRVGKEIMFYITRVNSSGRHVQTILRKFIDNENRYAGKLKYVQIHIGKFADTDRAYAPKIDHIKVFQLAQVTVDQTRYIADVGDIITFDHVNKEILINGEARNDLKAFGGLFFTLKKGENQLITHPANSFRTTGRYRPKIR